MAIRYGKAFALLSSLLAVVLLSSCSHQSANIADWEASYFSGQSALARKSFPSAESNLVMANQLAGAQLGDPVRQSCSLLVLGDAYSQMKRPELALKTYKQTVACCRSALARTNVNQAEIYETLLDCSSKIGILYGELGEETLAIQWYRKTIEIYNKPQIGSMASFKMTKCATGALVALAEILERANRRAEAIDAYTQALNICRSSQYAISLRNSLKRIDPRFAITTSTIVRSNGLIAAGNKMAAASLLSNLLQTDCASYFKPLVISQLVEIGADSGKLIEIPDLDRHLHELESSVHLRGNLVATTVFTKLASDFYRLHDLVRAKKVALLCLREARTQDDSGRLYDIQKLLGEIFLSGGNPERAASYYQAALACVENKQNFSILESGARKVKVLAVIAPLSRCYVLQNQLAKSEQLLTTYVASSPDGCPELVSQLVDVLLAQGKQPEAEKLIDSVTAKLSKPNTRIAQHLLRFARRNLQQESLAKSEVQTRKALKLSSNPFVTANAYGWLGLIYAKKGNKPKAIEYSTLGIRNFSQALDNAQLRLEIGWSSKAVARRQFHKLQLGYCDVLCLCQQKTDAVRVMQAAFDEATSADSSDAAELGAKLAFALRALGKSRESLAVLYRLAKIEMDRPHAFVRDKRQIDLSIASLSAVVRELLQQGQWRKALPLLERQLFLCHEVKNEVIATDTYVLLGVCQRELKEFSSAEISFRKAFLSFKVMRRSDLKVVDWTDETYKKHLVDALSAYLEYLEASNASKSKQISVREQLTLCKTDPTLIGYTLR